jgi:hypothetical protein
LSRRKEKYIEDKEEARQHKKAQSLYDGRKQAAVPEDNRPEPAETVINLQQTYGNKYVQRLMGKVQAKLIVNPPNNQYEKEADRVADAITKASTSNIQRQGEKSEKDNLVATKPTTEKQHQLFAVSGEVEADINAARGGGQPLPDSVRNSLEPQLGHNFSQVHIHTDAKANKLSQQLGAEAFTTGNDIFFTEKAYQPGSKSGRHLIAHELMHVVQQGAARVSRQAADMEGAAADPKEEAKSELKDVVGKIKTKLERDYIEVLLRIAGNCQAQGMEESVYKWAMEEAVEAASTVLEKKTAGLDVKSAKKEMVAELLNAAAEVMKLGGDDKAVESALKKALDWAEAQLASAMRKLETAPTQINAKEVAAKAAHVALLGGEPAEAWEVLKKWAEESGKKEQIK